MASPAAPAPKDAIWPPTPPCRGTTSSSPAPGPRPLWPGLLLVAVSINLPIILRYPGLPERALENVLLLLGVLVVRGISLTAGQGQPWDWIASRLALLIPVRCPS